MPAGHELAAMHGSTGSGPPPPAPPFPPEPPAPVDDVSDAIMPLSLAPAVLPAAPVGRSLLGGESDVEHPKYAGNSAHTNARDR